MKETFQSIDVSRSNEVNRNKIFCKERFKSSFPFMVNVTKKIMRNDVADIDIEDR